MPHPQSLRGPNSNRKVEDDGVSTTTSTAFIVLISIIPSSSAPSCAFMEFSGYHYLCLGFREPEGGGLTNGLLRGIDEPDYGSLN